MSVDILLATYNGGPFLKELLESIFCQSYRDFRLLIRDDGSDDSTCDILKEHADPRIEWIVDTQGRLGPIGNFNALLQASDAKVIFLADQDDIWHPHKVETMLRHLRTDRPFLLHSDLEVVDAHKNRIHPSFWRYAHLQPEKATQFHRILVQNPVTGCAAAFTRSLKEIVGEIPQTAMMHDAWLALVAAAFGTVATLDEPLVQYRQHGKNALGAKRFRWQGFKQRQQAYFASQMQAKSFLDIFGDRLGPSLQATLHAYLSQNRFAWIKHRLFKQGCLRNLAHLVLPYV
jgi:glycosyltransferase involved in cell wall biosynthesis